MIKVAEFCNGGKDYKYEDSYRGEMGRRPAKKSFFVVEKQNPPTKKDKARRQKRKNDSKKTDPKTIVLSMMQIPLTCPFTLHSDAEKKAFSSLIMNLKHPYILPVSGVKFDLMSNNDSESSITNVNSPNSSSTMDILVARKLCERGSLRDEIYGVGDPQDSYITKYPPKTKGVPLHPKKIRNYGRQILEAVLALQKRGITCYNLSSSNVMVDWDEASKNYVAKISDIENSLLCKRPSSSLENLTLVHENRVDVDVLHFGHLLFEMALGHRLHKSTPCQSVLKNEYEGVNAEISEVLWMIFSPESIRDKNICIEDVIKTSLFKDVKVKEGNSKINLNHSAKKIIKVCMASIVNFRSHRLEQYEASLRGPPMLVDTSSSTLDSH
ncbi:hypothetical protein TrVE_jg10428 [Triparma verrucosa]|uniref:Protein kinase domain-containing protein n=1 Tax=Triparma verrucosa TaxID=1606542 RepID=A0A9W7FCF6_9STRA|nr:hypothetical protein TrVE_jg10428 [Triparma verrucosa]